MDKHDRRERITLLLVSDALEANDQNMAEALAHLLDAAGSLIIHAKRRNGADAKVSGALAAQYLFDQVDRYAGTAS